MTPAGRCFQPTYRLRPVLLRARRESRRSARVPPYPAEASEPPLRRAPTLFSHPPAAPSRLCDAPGEPGCLGVNGLDIVVVGPPARESQLPDASSMAFRGVSMADTDVRPPARACSSPRPISLVAGQAHRSPRASAMSIKHQIETPPG